MLRLWMKRLLHRHTSRGWLSHASRPLGLQASFHGSMACGFRTARVSEVCVPRSGLPCAEADFVALPASGLSPARPAANASVILPVGSEPWPVSDGFTPFGFDGASTRRFAAVSTGDVRNRPFSPDGRPARLFRVQSLADLQLHPNRWRQRFQCFTGLLDHCENHSDVRLRAAVLAHAASVGLPVCLSDDRGLRGFLPDSLVDLWMATRPAELLNPHRRTQVAFRQWSATYDSLSMKSVWNRLLKSNGHAGFHPPSMSVLVATKRPEMIENWAPQLAAQDYPDFEVIAALHGEEFTTEDEALARRWLGDRLTILRIPERLGLGEVLNHATAAGSGELIVKWDDDDLYSCRHLSDLARIHDYSGATLAGKTCEYLYLAGSDMTVRQNIGLVESYERSPAGNTLCISRADLKDVGGWQPVRRAVDDMLIESVVRSGGSVYSASGLGHLVIRTAMAGHAHTWKAADAEFLERAIESRAGLALELALVDCPNHVAELLISRQQSDGVPSQFQPESAQQRDNEAGDSVKAA